MGVHAEPKVTIDLKEYNELLKHKETVEKGEHAAKQDIKPYQKALSSIIKAVNLSRLDPTTTGRILDAPRLEAVRISIQGNAAGNLDVYCEMFPTG